METLFEKLLDYYSLSKEDFNELSKNPEDIKLIDPNSILGMDKVKNRILKAIKNKEKIIVYGDYDCDGIVATSIMVKTFQKLNYPVSYYVPCRYIDGYGSNIENIKKIASNGFNLLILVDNGISANEEIELANSLNLDVIIIDHHEPGETLPNAVGIIHPFVSKISSISGSAGYMSLFVSAALLGEYDHYLVTLAGVSTVSDMMELKEYNRDVVKIAISNLRKYRYKQLISLCDSDVISEKTFSLELAPKINAVGRLIKNKNINLLVKYLTSEEENCQILDWINSVNESRKMMTKEISESLEVDVKDKPCLVIKSNILEGLIGLVANRLMNQYNLTTIVFTPNENDESLLKGSIRTKEGFNVVKAFASLEKYIQGGGGHAQAGGLTIKASDFDDFKTEFEKLCILYPIKEVEKKHIEISLKDITMENYDLIRKFAPFGVGFPEPLFRINNLPTKGLRFVGMNSNTLSTELSLSSKLLGFNMKKDEVQSHSFIDIFGTFNLNVSSRFGTSLEYRISEFKPSK